MRRPVTITLLFFAAVRELVGHSQQRLQLPEHVKTVAHLAVHLEQVIPSLQGRLKAVRFARNEELVQQDQVLGEGDVIALIPPVAGG